jgi:hypothetical protein
MYTHNPPEQFSPVTRAKRRWPYRDTYILAWWDF